jgi:hypothetical protein
MVGSSVKELEMFWSKLAVTGSLSIATVLLGLLPAVNLEFVIPKWVSPQGWSVRNTAYPAPVTLRAGPQRPNVERVNVAMIALRPSGFDPSQIIRLGSPFVLSVDNRTGLENISLILSDQAGNKLRETRLLRRRKWKEVIDLPSGRYMLSEAGHPDWICQITVTR